MVRHGDDHASPQADRRPARKRSSSARANRFDIDAAHFVLGRDGRARSRQHFGERALYEDGLEVITTIDIDACSMEARAHPRRLDLGEFEDTSDGHNGAFFALDPH